jgi:hypothetical protein
MATNPIGLYLTHNYLDPTDRLGEILFGVIFSSPHVALRVSNVLMVVMLFVIGMKWGDYAYSSRIGAGMIMAAVGLVVVGTA